MSCRRDNSFIEGLKLQISIKEDLSRVAASRNVLMRISNDIKNSYPGLLMEINNMADKVFLYLKIKSSVVNENEMQQLTLEQETRKSLKMNELDEKFKSEVEKFEKFEKRMTQQMEPMEETEMKWRQEKVPDETGLRKMTSQERKFFVKMWRDREIAAEEGRAIFEDLKAECDALNSDFSASIKKCLEGMESLRDSL